MTLLPAEPAHPEPVPDQLLFAPKPYVRTTGAPNMYTETVPLPVSVGPPFLLRIENGQPDGRDRVSAAWVAVNDVEVLGPNDFSQAPTVLERPVMLQPRNALRVKLAGRPESFLAVRLYGTAILPTPVALDPDHLVVIEGATAFVSVSLAPPPTTDGVLGVSLEDPTVATASGSVSFDAGQLTVPVPVSGATTGSTKLTISLNGTSITGQVKVTARPPTLTALEPPRQTLAVGASGTIRITMGPAQGSDTLVDLDSSIPGILLMPSSAIVPAGATSVAVPVTGNVPGTTRITASLTGSTVSGLVSVDSTMPTVVSLEPAMAAAGLGVSVPFTVRLSVAPAVETVVALECAPTGLVSFPATLVVPAGQLTATVPVTTLELGTALVTATLNGTASGVLHVTPPPPALTALGPTPLSLTPEATGRLTVVLNAARSVSTEVAVTVDQSGLLQVPGHVTIPAGQTEASFAVTGLAVGQAVVTATLGASSQAVLVHVVPPPPAIVSLLPSPLPLEAGASGSLTITISGAQPGETVVPLTVSQPIVEIPAAVTVPAGQTTVSVPVISVATGTATVTASLHTSTVSATVPVVPPPVHVVALVPPLTLAKGRPNVLYVTVSAAQTQPTVVTLTSSHPQAANTPGSVTIPAGALSAPVPLFTNGEGATVITATLGGTASTTVTVTPPEVVRLTLSPDTPSRYLGEPASITATGTYTDGTRDAVTGLTWTSSDESVATIDADGVVTTLAAGTTTITAAVSPTPGALSASTTLTVLPPAPMSVLPVTATMRMDEELVVTVTSASAAGEHGLTVTLTASGTGRVTITPSTVTIPVGASTAEFTVRATDAGEVTLTATATGRQAATSHLTIQPGVPQIDSVSPESGPVGTVVMISGRSFDPTAAHNQVRFNGVPAIISSASSSTITTTVPQGATSGPITVTTAQGTATSAHAFTVVVADFAITALPAPLVLPAIGQGAFAVTLAATGGFSTVATLAVSGLPSGVTAQLGAVTLAAGQSTTLSVRTTGTTPAGTYPLTVTATGLLNGAVVTRPIVVNLQVLSAGATSLSGQVLDEEARPVKGAVVTLGSAQTATDDGGNFLLPGVPVGADQLLFIDGGPASTPTRSYPIIPYKVTIVAGQANQLGFPVYLHVQKTTGLVDISNNGVERIVTDPELPGFEMRIPAGVTITGWDGQVNTQVSVRRVALDRNPLPPIPLGLHVRSIYMYYFGKRGGGTPSEPVPIVFPNDLDLPPGTQVELWFFDEAPDGSRPNQWARYGAGTVSNDGSQVIPDIDPVTGKAYGQPRFCCGGGFVAYDRDRKRAVDGQHGGIAKSPGGKSGGDPVDLATGLFTLEKTDLVLPDRLPVVFTRMYRTNGSAAGPFGPGTGHTFHILLQSEADLRTLHLPDGTRLLFSRQLDGTYRNRTDPAMQGIVITESGGAATLRFKDGTLWGFGTPVAGISFLTGQTDRNGNTITIARSGLAQNATTITAPSGRQLHLTYDGGNRITAVQDPLGRTVRYHYDGSGRLATVTDPAGGVTRYSYDSAGRMQQITDARGITFLINEYDAASRVSRQIQADGGVWRFEYLEAAGVITETAVTDPGGHVTLHRFNSRGYPISRTNALGQTTTFVRDGHNQVTATVDPLGRRTTLAYDAAGNVTSVADPEGRVTRFEYHPVFNRVIKIIDALEQENSFTYDERGNLRTSTDPLGHVTTIQYNGSGQPTAVTDALQHTTEFEYDDQGNLIVTRDPLGNETRRVYDAVSRLTAIVDPRGMRTQFQYDPVNRVTQIADARHGLTGFTYDSNGNLLTVTDAKGQTTTYTYDDMDRLAIRRDALGREERYHYDASGNVARFVDRKRQETRYTYDALNRRTAAAYADGSTTAFVFDAAGRLAEAVDSASGRIEFRYDVLDRLIEEITSLGTVTYEYDAVDRRSAMRVNGQSPVTYRYDRASRLTEVAQDDQVVGLGYDEVGRRTSLTYPNGTHTTYTYDEANRLLRILHDGPTSIIEDLVYTYDAAGNRVSLSRANGIASLLPEAVQQTQYDAANEQLQFGDITMTYDANGNLETETDATGTKTYSWDARNRLVGISGPGVEASFGYDVLGRRSRKTVGVYTIKYVYDRDEVIVEVSDGATPTNYIRNPRTLDEVFIMDAGDKRRQVHHVDHLKSTLAVTDDGGVVGKYEYEPFGQTAVSNPQSGVVGYTGRENDGDLYFYRARYYSPYRARFVSEDPIGIASGDVNFYAYVGNSPVAVRDPLGLYKRDVHYKLTLLLARQVMDIQAAKAVAAANQWLDDNAGTNALFDPLISGPRYHFTTPARRDELWKAALSSGDLYRLGFFLHALQDSYSHAGYSLIRLGHVPHSLLGDDPDDVCNDLEKAERMARDTYMHLRAYMMARTGGIVPDG